MRSACLFVAGYVDLSLRVDGLGAGIGGDIEGCLGIFVFVALVTRPT